MAEYGIAQCKVLVGAVADLVNVADKLLNGGGIFSAIGAIGDINALKGIDFAALRLEIGHLDPVEGQQLDAVFKSKINLSNPAVQAKVLSGVGEMDKAIALAGKVVALIEGPVTQLVGEGKVIALEVKALLGV